MGPMLVYYLRNALEKLLRTVFARESEVVVVVTWSKHCTNVDKVQPGTNVRCSGGLEQPFGNKYRKFRGVKQVRSIVTSYLA